MKGKDLRPPVKRKSGQFLCAACGMSIRPDDVTAWQRGWWVHPHCVDHGSYATYPPIPRKDRISEQMKEIVASFDNLKRDIEKLAEEISKR